MRCSVVFAGGSCTTAGRRMANHDWCFVPALKHGLGGSWLWHWWPPWFIPPSAHPECGIIIFRQVPTAVVLVFPSPFQARRPA